MEVEEQIRTLRDFLEQNYHPQLLEGVRKGQSFLVVNFAELIKFNLELSEEFLENPVELLKAAELAVKEFDLPTKIIKFNVRFNNLPDSQKVNVSDIRSKHLNKFVKLEGVVRQKTDVRPHVTASKYECPSCGNILTILQLDKKYKEPSRCGCGRKGKFKEISKELVDGQGLVLEEAPDELDGSQPRRINVFLKDDLVSPISERRSSPGSRVRVYGWATEVPITLKSGGQATKYDLIVEANFVEPLQEDQIETNLSPEELQKIEEIGKDPHAVKILADNIAPSIYGHDKIKEALVLQLAGGSRKVRPDGMITRGDMHILLIGDPGSAKSQLLKRISRVGPKARFTSGKGATAAGLTASVVKDEFLGGWSLEAGTLVLANHGFAVIDEMDKMGKDDRSALHEALEQQSYHYDTEIMFADGSTEKIGAYVDMLMEKYKEKAILGKDCEILPFPENETETLLTTNFNSIEEIPIDRISRHKAPQHFFKITLSNGRWITVTPEHPLYVADNGEIITLEARSVEEGMLVPAPRSLPTRKTALHKNDEVEGLFYGLQCSERYSYKSEKHRYAEIGISNTNPLIYSLAQEVMRTFFEKEPSLHLRAAENDGRATKELITVRVSSQQGYALLQQKVPELLHKAPIKRVPQYVKRGSDCLQRYFLQGFFLGDGFVDQERIGFCSSSRSLAQDLQQVCLQQNIYSYIETEQRESVKYYKVVLSGSESFARFLDLVHPSDPRNEKMKALLERSAGKNNDRDIIPHGYVNILCALLKSLRLDDGYFYDYGAKRQHAHRKTCQHYLDKIQSRMAVGIEALEHNDVRKIRRAWNIPLKEIAVILGRGVGTVYNYEKKEKDIYLQKVRQHAEIKKQKIFREVQKLSSLIYGDIHFVRIKKIEKIENVDQRWTYDVTIEPCHTFISQNLVLHNTVSIAKANIQATLRCETSVLAAANPKFGRFDPSGLVAEQIDLPPTLINRFDLIFPIKDMPNREKDEKVASFILALHKDPDKVGGTISTELLKKYFSYVRQKINPKMTDAAIDELKQYYISMRNSGQSEGTEVKTIPITARQLEALVRLSEAAAKVRLSMIVSREDAHKAIELLDYCLNQIAKDSETGKIDIDRLSSRITATQRSTIAIIKEIINSVEEELKSKTIPVENIVSAAQGKNISSELVDETLEKLRRTGDIFEPKRGFIQKL